MRTHWEPGKNGKKSSQVHHTKCILCTSKQVVLQLPPSFWFPNVHKKHNLLLLPHTCICLKCFLIGKIVSNKIFKLKNEVILEFFESPKVRKTYTYVFFSPACNQKYRRMIKDLYIISGLQARFWLNLPRDGRHIFYVFL